MENINLKDKSVESLKAMVYDQLMAKEVAENNIRVLNQEIGTRLKSSQSSQPQIEEPKPEQKE